MHVDSTPLPACLSPDGHKAMPYYGKLLPFYNHQARIAPSESTMRVDSISLLARLYPAHSRPILVSRGFALDLGRSVALESSVLAAVVALLACICASYNTVIL